MEEKNKKSEEAIVALYDYFKLSLSDGTFTLKELEVLVDLLTELVARKKEEQESGEQEG